MGTLVVERVVAGYHEGIDILSGLSLTARSRSVTAVIGPNGAGKSTLLRVVFGLLAPRAGRVAFGGRGIQGLRPDERKRLGIGYVPQGPSTFPQMTVEETLLVGGGRSAATARACGSAWPTSTISSPRWRTSGGCGPPF